MTTYNTGNPIGSTDPRDLYDNAENFDDAVNSSADTFQDRLGKSRLTWTGIVKAGSGDPSIAVDAAARAAAAAGRAEAAEAIVDATNIKGLVNEAEAARDAAFVNADVYPDVATGRAAVADGEQFQVLSDDGMEYIRYRKDSASAQTEVGRYPSSAAVAEAADAVSVQYQQPNLFSLQQLNFEIIPPLGDGTSVREIVNGVVALRIDTNESGIASQSWRFQSPEFPSGFLSASVVIESMEAGSSSAFSITFRDAGFNSLGVVSLAIGGGEIVNPTVFRHEGLAVPAGTAYVDFNVTAAKTGGDMSRRAYVRSMLLADGKNSSFRQPPPDKPPVLNHFPVPDLSSTLATQYQAERIIEDGESVLRLSGSSLQQVHYEFPAAGIFSPGNTLTISAEAWADVDPIAPVSTADVNILCLDGSGGTIGALPATQNVSGAEIYTRQEVSRVVPEGTVTIRIRFVKRAVAPNIAQEAKFRRVVLTSSSSLAKVVNVGGGSDAGGGGGVVAVVSPGGGYSSIQAGIDAAKPYGTVVVRQGDYPPFSINGFYGRILAHRNERVRVIGGTLLAGITKTSGQDSVYQAALPNAPHRYVWEHDTPDALTAIDPNERHPLQRGLAHRLPSTRMIEVSSIQAVDESPRPAWFWSSGVVYFKTSDGLAPGSREIRVASGTACVAGGTGGEVVDICGISGMYGLNGFALKNCARVRLERCDAMFNRQDGFALWDNLHVENIMPRAGGNGNDGTNGHVYGANSHDVQASFVMVEPWCHDNWDDGDSLHELCIGSYQGGLIEYNGSGITTAVGAHVTLHGGVVRNNGAVSGNGNPNPKDHGVSSIGDPVVDGGVGTQVVCYGTVSEGSARNFYAAGANNSVDCFRTLSIGASSVGYVGGSGGQVRTYDCGDSGSAVPKSGAVEVKNSELVV